MSNTSNNSSLSTVKQALLALQSTRSQLLAVESAKYEPIAIIGIGCRYPGGVNSLKDFWNLLNASKDIVGDIPSTRWNAHEYHDNNYDNLGKIVTTKGAFFTNVQESDPIFFGISPKEAKSMDPQQHLLLEVCWETLESAGVLPETLRGSKTGVFIGICNQDYSTLLMTREKEAIDAYMTTGMAHSVAAGRISYIFGFQGPCLAVDTACSSSLVAIHLACQSLRNKESDFAIAGGVNLILCPETSIDFSRNHMLSTDGLCKAFSEEANGFGRGEGCGLVFLKRLSDVDTTKEHVLALIKGSATNQDGSSSGLTAPNGPSQQRVILDALENARVSPSEIEYIEAHGTGTSLGDPIEIGALNQTLCIDRDKSNPLLIGSVKTNLGHSEAAAGVSGLIKVVLAMQHNKIPPHLHCHALNTHIPWDEMPIKVTKEGVSWSSDEKPHIAGVSSFGFSGTNCHIIIQQSSPEKTQPFDFRSNIALRPKHILHISGRSFFALKDQVRRYASHLLHLQADELINFCFSANTTRTHFEHQLVLCASSIEEFIEQMENFLQNETTSQQNYHHSDLNLRSSKVAWFFTGQGSQFSGMGKELYETQPVFKATIDECAKILQPLIDISLTDLLFKTDSEIIHQTQYTQPALFAFEYALGKMWLSWGVKPTMVAGHSVGEYVAACIAGVFSLNDALYLICARARLMQSIQHPGAMVSIVASAASIQELIFQENLENFIEIAAINTPQDTVISGDEGGIKQLIYALEKQKMRFKVLKVSHAFHSKYMDPILEEYQGILDTVKYSSPNIPIVSNLTGNVIFDEITNSSYWINQLRKTVQFSKIIEYIFKNSINTILEIGPQPILIGMCEAHPLKTEHVQLLPSIFKTQNSWDTITETVCQLHLQNHPIDWNSWDLPYRPEKISIPTYAFNRQRHWFNDSLITARESLIPTSHLLNLIKSGQESQVVNFLMTQDTFNKNDNTIIQKIANILIKDYQSTKKITENFYIKPIWLEQKKKDFQNTPIRKRNIILFDPSGDTQVTELINELNHTCIQIISGSNFSKKSDVLWTLNLSNAGHFSQVIQDISSENTIDDIFFVWPKSLFEKGPTDFSIENLLLSISALCKATNFLVNSPKIWFIQPMTSKVNHELFSIPFSSVLNGFCRSLFLECPQLKGGLVELDLLQLNEFILELQNPVHEDQLRFQNGARYVGRIQRTQLSTRQNATFQKSASYLITGGLGAIGRKILEMLVQDGAHQIFVMTRSAPQKETLTYIEALEKSGPKITVLLCDCSNLSDMSLAFEKISQQDFPLKGLFHAAGIIHSQPALELKEKQVFETLQAKIHGTWLLHQFTQSMQLDFFVMFSSISALVGSSELATYAAANSFMDGFSNYRHSLNLPSMSINWGPWQDKGMVQYSQEGGYKIKASGLRELVPDEAIKLLKELLPNAFPQIGIVDADWNQLNNLYATRGEINIFDLLIDQEKIENFDVRPSLFLELENIPVWDRFDYLVLQLQAQIRSLLQFSEKEEVDPKRGFFDMGMDSLMALRLKAFLEKGFSIKLPPSIIFDYPKIELLAHHLLDIVFLDPQQELHSKQALEPTPTSFHSNSLQIIHESEQLTESEISKLIDNEWLELNSLKDNK